MLEGDKMEEVFLVKRATKGDRQAFESLWISTLIGYVEKLI